MKRALIVILILTNCLISQAQVYLDLEKGDKAYDDLAFDEALYFYDIANETQPNDPTIIRRIANVYRRIGQMAISAEWYRKSIDLGSTNPLDMLYYAESLKSLGQYDEAIIWYEKYGAIVPSDTRAKNHLRDREYYKDLYADTLRYSMKKLKLNNADPVIGIAAFEGEKYLLAAINADDQQRDGKKYDYLNYLDIYEVDFNSSNELVNPTRLEKAVNSKYHDGPAFYSPINKALYITRNNIRNGKPVLDKNGSVNLKIYVSRYENGVWKSAQELKFGSDDYSVGHPFVTKDGQFMYLISNRPGGYGGTDLYVSQKNADLWSDPINLGPNVNTEGNEMFPFVGEDGLLYFASDGHAGLGGLDVFASDQLSGIWQRPSNLGAPINSSSDDFSLSYKKEGDKGFFCSNRSGRGNDDIFYYTHIDLTKTILAGTIQSKIEGLSFAGERVRILTKNSGMVTEQRLNEKQAFSVSAEPEDEIEVYMMDAEYFDPNIPVFSTVISTPILDPFINLGAAEVDLKKDPGQLGRLIDIKDKGLAPTATAKLFTDAIEAEKSTSKVDEEAAVKALEEEKKQRNAAEKLDLEYRAACAKGDAAFAQKKWTDALSSYSAALQLKGNETYPKSKIFEINQILATDAAAKKQQEEEILAAKLKAQKDAQELAKKNAEKIDFASAETVVDLESMSLDNVQFDYNKSFIRDIDKSKLDKVIQIMKENPNTKLLIKAFCDSRGSMTYNQSLSMSRAMAVQGYLMQHGIKRERLQSEWFGEQRPLNECEDGVPCSEDQYEVNRRAEFKLVAMKTK